ncbi:MAG TPA: hypothetical protein VMB81_29625 [Candidatus Sulfotelmatobacter sp.]|nr:hypothetical protein [Candidatus Sulfotelmatobacter sp.]
MAKSAAILLGAALMVAGGVFTAGAAEACSYEGQAYPPGTVLCIGGKQFICQSNDAWKVDRSSSCSN